MSSYISVLNYGNISGDFSVVMSNFGNVIINYYPFYYI